MIAGSASFCGALNSIWLEATCSQNRSTCCAVVADIGDVLSASEPCQSLPAVGSETRKVRMSPKLPE